MSEATSVQLLADKNVNVLTSMLGGGCMMALSLPSEFRGVDYYVITNDASGTSGQESFIYLVADDAAQTATVTLSPVAGVVSY